MPLKEVTRTIGNRTHWLELLKSVDGNHRMFRDLFHAAAVSGIYHTILNGNYLQLTRTKFKNELREAFLKCDALVKKLPSDRINHSKLQ